MGPLQVPCACGDGSRKVLVSWPKGLQKPNSIVGTFGDQEQESFCPFTEKQRKPSPGSASLSRFPMNFAMPMQPKQHHSNIWSLLHCKASLCIPGWWSFLFSHPVPAHQLSWSPQFCVLWPFVSVKVVLEVVFEISSWVLWHELNPGIGAGEMHSTEREQHTAPVTHPHWSEQLGALYRLLLDRWLSHFNHSLTTCRFSLQRFGSVEKGFFNLHRVHLSWERFIFPGFVLLEWFCCCSVQSSL